MRSEVWWRNKDKVNGWLLKLSIKLYSKEGSKGMIISVETQVYDKTDSLMARWARVERRQNQRLRWPL